MNTKEVEKALVSNRFLVCGYKGRYVVVPNVSYGLSFNHELDILALSKNGYVHEIEIKISVADLKRDFLKPHHHFDKRIKFLWYAGPESMKKDFETLIPAHCGIMLVRETGKKTAYVYRKPKPMKAKPLTKDERLRLYELMLLRYWTIKLKQPAYE